MGESPRFLWRRDVLWRRNEVTRSLFFPTPFLKATLATCPNSRGDIVYMPAFFHVQEGGYRLVSGPDDRSIYKSLSTQEPRDGGGAPGGGDLAMEKVPEQRVPEQRVPQHEAGLNVRNCA